MPIYASKGDGKEYYLVPAGTSQAVCYDIWDIGFQEGEWQGKKIVNHKVIIGFEITELVPKGEFEGKHMTINNFYTLSLASKANLRKHLEGWRGKAFTEQELEKFDIEKLIGVNCMLNIIHNENGKAKIVGISRLMNGLIPLIAENKRSSPEWVAKFLAKAVADPYVDDEEIAMKEGEANAAEAEGEPIPF